MAAHTSLMVDRVWLETLREVRPDDDDLLALPLLPTEFAEFFARFLARIEFELMNGKEGSRQ